MFDFSGLIASLIPSLIMAVFVAWMNNKQKKRDDAQKARDEAQRKRDEQAERRAEARKKESLLGLEMQFAAAKLSYANAKALQDGKVNGEVREGIEAYKAAKIKYTDFLNEQAADHIYK